MARAMWRAKSTLRIVSWGEYIEVKNSRSQGRAGDVVGREGGRVERKGGEVTYHMRMATAKAPLACWQNPRTAPVCATEQLCVMYHGAPGCGCWGSLMSEPAWPWMLTA